jgi:hypothetical protein
MAVAQRPAAHTPLAQSLPRTHSTQTPAPLHCIPAVPQARPAAVGGLLAAPDAQTSSVQALPSTGRSVSSGRVVTAPLPSHTLARQSRAVWAVVRVPAAALATPHTPAAQVRRRHSVSAPPGHTLPQRPQWARSSETGRSQPLAALPSQSSKPAAQA